MQKYIITSVEEKEYRIDFYAYDQGVASTLAGLNLAIKKLKFDSGIGRFSNLILEVSMDNYNYINHNSDYYIAIHFLGSNYGDFESNISLIETDLQNKNLICKFECIPYDFIKQNYSISEVKESGESKDELKDLYSVFKSLLRNDELHSEFNLLKIEKDGSVLDLLDSKNKSKLDEYNFTLSFIDVNKRTILLKILYGLGLNTVFTVFFNNIILYNIEGTDPKYSKSESEIGNIFNNYKSLSKIERYIKDKPEIQDPQLKQMKEKIVESFTSIEPEWYQKYLDMIEDQELPTTKVMYTDLGKQVTLNVISSNERNLVNISDSHIPATKYNNTNYYSVYNKNLSLSRFNSHILELTDFTYYIPGLSVIERINDVEIRSIITGVNIELMGSLMRIGLKLSNFDNLFIYKDRSHEDYKYNKWEILK